MKKIGWTVLFLFSVLTLSSDCEAAYGPYLSFDVGSYSRRVTETNPNFPGLKFDGTPNSTRALATLGLDLNSVDLYLTLGGANMIVDDFDMYHGKMDLAYGGGFKFVLFESPTYERFKFFINPDILYFKTNDTIQTYSISLGTYLTQNHEISWTEYQVRMGASARYDFMEPYGGIKYSGVSGQETAVSGDQIDRFGTADIVEKDNLGFFFGANFYFDPSGRASLYGEIAGGDNNYLKVGIKSRF